MTANWTELRAEFNFALCNTKRKCQTAKRTSKWVKDLGPFSHTPLASLFFLFWFSEFSGQGTKFSSEWTQHGTHLVCYLTQNIAACCVTGPETISQTYATYKRQWNQQPSGLSHSSGHGCAVSAFVYLVRGCRRQLLGHWAAWITGLLCGVRVAFDWLLDWVNWVIC